MEISQFKDGKNPPANFNSLAIMPAQRIMRYPMYFEELLKEAEKKGLNDLKKLFEQKV